MARRIYKYPIDGQENFGITMPVGAEILHAGVQDGQAYVWALVDPDAPYELHLFSLYGTGESVDEPDYRPKIRYVDTFQMNDGELVFHLFERKA